MVQLRHAHCLIVLTSISLVLLVLNWPKSVVPLGSIGDENILRVLPLGDSITRGLFSPNGNGYRLRLQELLVNRPIHYIGSQRFGDMSNNANEGHSDATIEEIGEFARPALLERPDVVLLMAGTNDFLHRYQPLTAALRLSVLIDHITSTCPQAAVLVAQIPPIRDAEPDAFVVPYNEIVQGLVQEKAGRGQHILAVDMHSRFTTDDLLDGVHPNESGCEILAQAWFEAIQVADSMGWLA